MRTLSNAKDKALKIIHQIALPDTKKVFDNYL